MTVATKVKIFPDSGNTFNVETGTNSGVGGGRNNTASEEVSTVSGGSNNTADGYATTISGGISNTATGVKSVISGGENNVIETDGSHSVIGGGYLNHITESTAVIGGGQSNEASALAATIAGGTGNIASDVDATIVGGANNTASAIGATVIGGTNNVANGIRSIAGGFANSANGEFSSIPGGRANTTAVEAVASFAIGNFAKTDKSGQFAHSCGNQVNTESDGSSQYTRVVYFTESSGTTENFIQGIDGNGYTLANGRNYAITMTVVAAEIDGANPEMHIIHLLASVDGSGNVTVSPSSPPTPTKSIGAGSYVISYTTATNLITFKFDSGGPTVRATATIEATELLFLFVPM